MSTSSIKSTSGLMHRFSASKTTKSSFIIQAGIPSTIRCSALIRAGYLNSGSRPNLYDWTIGLTFTIRLEVGLRPGSSNWANPISKAKSQMLKFTFSSTTQSTTCGSIWKIKTKWRSLEKKAKVMEWASANVQWTRKNCCLNWLEVQFMLSVEILSQKLQKMIR